jgi:hypothetical protein
MAFLGSLTRHITTWGPHSVIVICNGTLLHEIGLGIMKRVPYDGTLGLGVMRMVPSKTSWDEKIVSMFLPEMMLVCRVVTNLSDTILHTFKTRN